jgi:hypothetical protein
MLKEGETDSKNLQWVLYVILGSLIIFLVVVAYILEKILSRAKQTETKQQNKIKQKMKEDMQSKSLDEEQNVNKEEFLTNNLNEDMRS